MGKILFENAEPTKYPSIHLDTFSYCNASCAFCSYSKMVRPKGKMDFDLFKKVIDEIATWEEPVEVCPVHYGEFFLNPDWFAILQYMDEKLPKCKVSIPTNGSKFTQDVVDKLSTIKNLYYLSFSVYAFFPASYKLLMGLPEDNLLRIEHAYRAMQVRRPDVGVVLGATHNSLFGSPIELHFMKQKWGTYLHLHDITLNKSHGFHKSFVTIEICHQPYNCMVVLWDGTVCVCCMDPNGELVVGDVKKQSIMEIWKGPVIGYYRDLHNKEGGREQIPLCNSCTCTAQLDS